jgi:ABC-2 type transport system ATP-binding protein
MGTQISVDGVSKVFHVHHVRILSLKERVLRMGRTPLEDFWALRNIDLQVEEGETVGVLGHNGSGKSTLLKCVAGILKPTSGEIRIRGRVASLLELGAGFHPDLTGRENVYINASFLGIPKKEIERKFEEIVAFAELEQFIDNQVKYYSSGMFVRLGFAVAINVDPDVLLVDEVLAVGDEVFQKKCLDRIDQFQRDGRTILFVTHSADLVRKICNRAVVLHHGEMVANGSPGESIRIFREYLHGHLEETPSLVARDLPGDARITGVALRHPGHPDRRYLFAGEPLTIEVELDVAHDIDDPVLAIEVYDTVGNRIYGADTDTLGAPMPALRGPVRVSFHMASVPLLDGAYPLVIHLKDRHQGRLLAFREQQDAFEVVNPSRVEGNVLLPFQVSVDEHTGGPTRA